MRQIPQFIFFFLLGLFLSFIPQLISGSAPFATAKISETASQVTVRIYTRTVAGSGVIVGREEDSYTVVTNRHVVGDDCGENNCKILTAEGRFYPAKLLPFAGLEKLDVAKVEFGSSSSYPVAKLGSYGRLEVGDVVYAVGFPNWRWRDEETVENTRDLGLKAFTLTAGRVGMKPERSLEEGYQLGYTNDIMEGMSGGGIFNGRGELVGINGRAKYPLAGIEAFRFADGSLPSRDTFERMEAFSWGRYFR
ncbi:MAG: serine protease [Cyanobacteriota bacterium]|nr:serine protease [Cyanobacteriota bacterium]